MPAKSECLKSPWCPGGKPALWHTYPVSTRPLFLRKVTTFGDVPSSPAARYGCWHSGRDPNRDWSSLSPSSFPVA